MDSGSEEARKLSVFISYSRDDFDFADQLDAALNALGFSTILDRHGISGGEDWKHRLGNLIRDADTVVFVLSPASAGSEICAWEVKEAVRLGKRIIPVLCRPLEGATAPRQLSDLNYIFFYAEPKSPGSGFGTGQARLVAALNTDLDWLREHTRYLQRASEWDSGGRPRNRLLSGADVGLAKAWVDRRPRNAPAPTGLHLDYIKASEEWDRQQQSAERQRLQQMAEAQAAREAALADKEIAQQREAEGSRRLVQRTMIGLAAALLLAVLAGAFGVYALHQRSEAELRGNEAKQATQLAIATRNEALLNQSRFLTFSASQAIEQGDTTAALLLALEAMRDEKHDDATMKARPLWPQAETSLATALRAMRERVILKGHTDFVFGVAVTADGSRIVTGSDDGTARVWQVSTGKELLQLKGHTGSVQAVALLSGGTRIVTGGMDNTARIWDVGTGKEILQLKGHTSRINSVAVTPDGKRIVTGSDDGTARVWDAAAGKEIVVIRGHSDQVYAVAVTPDGTGVITGGSDNTARLWSLSTGLELRQFRGHNGDVQAVAVAPDGTRIVTGSTDATARVWDVRTGAELLRLEGHKGRIYALAITPDGAHIVTGAWGEGPARVWDAVKGKELFQLKGHTADVNGVAVTPDGTRIVTTSDDGTARVWELTTSKEMFQLVGHKRPVNAVAAFWDGLHFLTGSDDGTARVWDAKTRAERYQLKGNTGNIYGLAVTRDGSRIITGSGDSKARIWEAGTGKGLIELVGHDGPVNAVAVTHDGSRIVTGSDDSTARVWDARTGKQLALLKGHTARVYGVAITPDGSRVVTGAWGGGQARVWDANTGKELFPLKGHTQDVNGVAVTSDGTRFLTASDDGTARVWDVSTGKEIQRLKGHTGYVYSVAATPDGKRIVTAGADTTVRIWDATTGKELAHYKGHIGNVLGVVVSADGKQIVSGSEDGTVRVWTMPSAGQALVEEAKAVVPRCLTPGERQRFYLATAPSRWCGNLQKWPYDDVGSFIEGRRLATLGDEEAAAAVLDMALERDPSAAKRIDQAWAEGHIARGRTLTSEVNDEEAKAVFAKALVRDPTAAKRIDMAWVNAFIDRGSKLLKDRADEKATEAFAAALERDRSAATRIDKIWVTTYVDRGRSLLGNSKDEDAKAVFKLALAKDTAAAKRIDEMWVNAYIDRGRRHVVGGEDGKAKEVFAQALGLDSGAAKRVDQAWVNAYFDRARNLVSNGADEDAKAVFALALAREPGAARRVDQAWASGSISRGNNLLNEAERDALAREAKGRDALAAFDRAIQFGRRDGVDRGVLTDAIMARGRAYDSLKQYTSAIADFKEAMTRGHKEADNWAWWSTIRLADQMRDEQSKPVHALLMTAVNYLDLTPELKSAIALNDLKSNASAWVGISSLFSGLQRSAAVPTTCDQLAAHQSDPFRVAPGVPFDTIKSEAREECEKEAKQNPQEPRYRFQHARALSRAADLDKAKREEHHAATVIELKAAMAAGYPTAFSNMAYAHQFAQGVPKDENKAADLYLETFNRIVHCCWVPVARHLLAQEAQHDVKTVRRVVHELLLWASALGSEQAQPMLNDLYAKGTLERPLGRPSLSRADFGSLPPWLR